MSKMIILAIDPGPVLSAYLLLDVDKKKPIRWGKIANQTLLDLIADNSLEPYDYMIIEKIASMGMIVGQTIFDTCIYTGRLQQAFESKYEVPVQFIYRREVKTAICKTQKANDSTIRSKLIEMYGPPGTRKQPGVTFGITADVWSCLALSTTWCIKNGI